MKHNKAKGSQRAQKGNDSDDDGNGSKIKVREEEVDSVSIATYQILSPGGGVADGEVESSPGCSGMSVSAGEPGPCMPGGVEEVLRARVAEPFRDTQEVSITRTPILETNTQRESHTVAKEEIRGVSEGRSW